MNGPSTVVKPMNEIFTLGNCDGKQTHKHSVQREVLLARPGAVTVVRLSDDVVLRQFDDSLLGTCFLSAAWDSCFEIGRFLGARRLLMRAFLPETYSLLQLSS